VVSLAQLDECVRDALNPIAERAMAVCDPVKLTITNYVGEEELDFEKNPVAENSGTRKIKFTGSVYIERSDFALVPPPKFKRLYKGGTVRLKAAYIVRCDDVVLNSDGEVEEILCTYFSETRSGSDIKSDIKAKGVIQWVDAKYGLKAQFKNYGPLLKDEEYPDQDYAERLNKDSLKIVYGYSEPYAAEAQGASLQLMRTGYYKVCPMEGDMATLSQIVSLKDNFNK